VNSIIKVREQTWQDKNYLQFKNLVIYIYIYISKEQKHKTVIMFFLKLLFEIAINITLLQLVIYYVHIKYRIITEHKEETKNTNSNNIKNPADLKKL